MSRRSASLAAVAAAGILGAGVAGAAVGATSAPVASYRISAAMTAKQVTKPAAVGNVSKARGTVTGTATLASRSQVAWQLTYSGMTGRVVAALVRFKNPKGVTSAISLCVKPCKSGMKSYTFFRTRAEGEYFVQQVQKGKVDAVLETKRNPLGEIRGVLSAREG